MMSASVNMLRAVAMSEKARRASFQLGSIEVEGFMLPDGSYRMSQTQASEAIGLAPRNVFDFLRSKAIKSLLGEGYTVSDSSREIEIEPDKGQSRGHSRIQAIPLEVVSAYWLWQSYRGNKQALALCMALIIESLERRFDTVFGIERSESKRNDRLTQQVQRLERALNAIGAGLEFDDDVRRERDYFLQVLRENNIDPYAIEREGDRDG